MNEALAYIDKSLDNVADLDPDTAWTNVEVVEVVEDIRSLLVAGELTQRWFEQAHAPTSDEREALANLIDDELQSQRIFDLRDIASAILAAGFRRAVQGEPTDAMEYLDALNEQGRIEYDDYRNLHDLISEVADPAPEIFPGTLAGLDNLTIRKAEGR